MPINVTGRDDFIICRALECAIAAMDGLPEEDRPFSDQEDMRLLLAHLGPVLGPAEIPVFLGCRRTYFSSRPRTGEESIA